MKEITRINHVGLRVSNLETTREFYEKLGFEFIIGPIGPEPVAIMEHPSGVNINFILNGSFSENNILMDVAEKHGHTDFAAALRIIQQALLVQELLSQDLRRHTDEPEVVASELRV